MFQTYILEEEINSLNIISQSIESYSDSLFRVIDSMRKLKDNDLRLIASKEDNNESNQDGQSKNSTKSFGSRFKEKIKAILKAIADFFRRIKNAIVNLFNKYTFDSKVASENSGQRSAFFLKGCKNSSELGKYLNNESAVLHHCIGNIMFQLTFNGNVDFLGEFENGLKLFNSSISHCFERLRNDEVAKKDGGFDLVGSAEQDIEYLKSSLENFKQFSKLFQKSLSLDDFNKILNIRIGEIKTETKSSYVDISMAFFKILSSAKSLISSLDQLKGKNIRDLYDFSIAVKPNNVCTFKKVDVQRLEKFKNNQKNIINEYKNGMKQLEDLTKSFEGVFEEEGGNDEKLKEHINFLNHMKNIAIANLSFIKNYFFTITEVCRRIGGKKLAHNDISEKAND